LAKKSFTTGLDDAAPQSAEELLSVSDFQQEYFCFYKSVARQSLDLADMFRYSPLDVKFVVGMRMTPT